MGVDSPSRARPGSEGGEAATGFDASFDESGLRRALGTFITGITVVTTIDRSGAPRGLTVNSFASVSLHPPLILVCIARSAASMAALAASGRFAVNILAEDQKKLSALFASRIEDKFASVRWDRSPLGNPLISGAAAWFDCVTEQTVDAGDHMICLGRVKDFGSTSDAPLGYCRGTYLTFDLGQRA